MRSPIRTVECTDDQGVHLIVQYFKSPRQREYDEALLTNLQHEHVSRVHVLLENNDDRSQLERLLSRLDSHLSCAQRDKIVGTIFGRQMKYSDAFTYSNQQLSGKVCVILNGDIAIGEGVELLLAQRDAVFGSRKKVLSLTRHEKDICLHQSAKLSSDIVCASDFLRNNYCGCPFMKRGYAGSHDSFWFVPPIEEKVVRGVDHVQNRWGAEHNVINMLIRCNYSILNPSRSIRTYHIHSSDLRPWSHQPEGRKILADPRDHVPLPPTVL